MDPESGTSPLYRTYSISVAAGALCVALVLYTVTSVDTSLALTTVRVVVFGLMAAAVVLLFRGLGGRRKAPAPADRQSQGDLADSVLELLSTSETAATLVVEQRAWRILACSVGCRRLLGVIERDLRGTGLVEIANGSPIAEQILEVLRAEVDSRRISVAGFDYDLTLDRVPVGDRGIVRVCAQPVNAAEPMGPVETEAVRSAEEVRKRLLANVSHDLRTPLVSMRGYAELLAKGGLGDLTDRQRLGVQTMLRNLDRLLAMIEDLLKFGEMKSGEATLKTEVFDLVTLGSDVVELAQTQARQSGLDLQIRIDSNQGGGSVIVHADRIRLNRVLLNLVGNALKFTPNGGKVRVYLRYAAEDEVRHIEEIVRSAGRVEAVGSRDDASDSQWVLLRVLDTGIGIPKEDLDRVFGWGNRLAHSATGSGLGLSITDEIVRMHSGLIELQSEVGEGTVFSVWLPVGRSVPQTGSVHAGRRGQRVLVIDDERDILEFAREVLSQEGYDVRVAETVDRVWSIVETWSPDTIITDYSLRGVEGHELIKVLQSDERLAHVAIGAMSAHSDKEVEERCRAAGAQDYLRKPFGIEELTRFVFRLVPGEPFPRAPATGPVSQAARVSRRDDSVG